jgi:hypothetical protein
VPKITADMKRVGEWLIDAGAVRRIREDVVGMGTHHPGASTACPSKTHEVD